MELAPIKVIRSGDSALFVRATSTDFELNWQTVHRLSRVLRHNHVPGIAGLIPTYDSVLVELDNSITSVETITTIVELLRDLVPSRAETWKSRTFEVPVLYGCEYGPDLEQVASAQALEIDEFIGRHSSRAYIIRCYSAGGAAMMDGPALPAPVPRRTDPRTKVAPGSVGVAGIQSMVFATESPSGWQLVGRTPLTLFDLDSPSLVPYEPGDTVTFIPIDRDEWALLEGKQLVPRDA